MISKNVRKPPKLAVNENDVESSFVNSYANRS